MCSATGNVRYGPIADIAAMALVDDDIVVVNSANIAAYLDYRYP